jgi:hypothetical protein
MSQKASVFIFMSFPSTFLTVRPADNVLQTADIKRGPGKQSHNQVMAPHVDSEGKLTDLPYLY